MSIAVRIALCTESVFSHLMESAAKDLLEESGDAQFKALEVCTVAMLRNAMIRCLIFMVFSLAISHLPNSFSVYLPALREIPPANLGDFCRSTTYIYLKNI